MAWSDAWRLGASMWANGLAMQETALAASGVIAHRSRVIEAAWRDPAQADLVELGRMVSEKADAFGKAGQSLAEDWIRLQAQLVAQAADMMRVWSAGAAGQSAAKRVGPRGAKLALDLSRASGRALAPVRTAAAANRRRLRRKKAPLSR